MIVKGSHKNSIKRLLAFTGFVLVLVTHAFPQTYKFGDYMQFGRNELKKGNFNQAINYLNSAIKHRPASYEGWFLRGIAKYYLDDFYGAEQDFTESMKFDPYNAEIYHMRAIVRSRQYNFGGAMADYNSAIELNPKDPLFYLNRARSHLFLEAWDSCIADCNRAINLKYKKTDVFLLRGTAKAGLEEYDDAIADLTTAIQKAPEKTNAIIQRGAVWMEINEPDSAIADFNKAIHINPDDSYAIFNRALAYMETSDTSAAFNDLNTVIGMSPYNSYAYYNRAILYLGQDEFKNALADLDNVIALNPENIIVYLFRGKLKASMGNYKGAMNDFSKAIEIYPDFADAYYERSKVKEIIGDLDGAEKDMKFAYLVDELNFGRGDSISLDRQMYLKRLIAFSGDFSQQRSDPESQNMSGISMQPAYVQVLFANNINEIVFYETVGIKQYHTNVITLTNDEGLVNTELAQQELEALNDSIPDNDDLAAYYLKKANLYSDVHDFNSAMQYYDRSIAEDPKRIMAWFGRANTRLKLVNLIQSDHDQQYMLKPVDSYSTNTPEGRSDAETHTFEQVLDDFDQVISTDPDFYIAWYNRGYVKSLKGDYWGAVSDFTRALELNPDFSEASYNKGLILIYLNLRTVGCRDMSSAGEGGITSAYEVMKRFCNR